MENLLKVMSLLFLHQLTQAFVEEFCSGQLARTKESLDSICLSIIRIIYPLFMLKVDDFGERNINYYSQAL